MELHAGPGAQPARAPPHGCGRRPAAPTEPPRGVGKRPRRRAAAARAGGRPEDHRGAGPDSVAPNRSRKAAVPGVGGESGEKDVDARGKRYLSDRGPNSGRRRLLLSLKSPRAGSRGPERDFATGHVRRRAPHTRCRRNRIRPAPRGPRPRPRPAPTSGRRGPRPATRTPLRHTDLRQPRAAPRRRPGEARGRARSFRPLAAARGLPGQRLPVTRATGPTGVPPLQPLPLSRCKAKQKGERNHWLSFYHKPAVPMFA